MVCVRPPPPPPTHHQPFGSRPSIARRIRYDIMINHDATQKNAFTAVARIFQRRGGGGGGQSEGVVFPLPR